MDLPTQAHLKTLRDLLTYRLGELRAEVHAAEQERQADAAEGGQGVADRKDEATRGQAAALSGQQEERDRRRSEPARGRAPTTRRGYLRRLRELR